MIENEILGEKKISRQKLLQDLTFSAISKVQNVHQNF